MNELFLKIINMSISASWLILAVLILRLVLRKAPKWVNVLLWGIVAVRLICPFTIASPVSLIPDAIGSGELVSEWMDDYIDDIDIHYSDSIYYDAAIGAGREPISDGEGGYYVVTKHDQLGEPATIENTVIPILSVVWIAGITVLVLYTVISYWHLRRKIDTAVLYRDNIFQSENVSSPFVLGIIKPKIYLPFKMDGQDTEHVVAHEQAHIYRKDHWWKPLGFFLLTIHWFNPLMWLAYVLLCRDIELACDEKVIKELSNEQRADYTQALVACSVNHRMITACPLTFGEVGVKERVKSIMNYKKPAFWVIALAVIACVIVAICFLTDPSYPPHNPIVLPATDEIDSIDITTFDGSQVSYSDKEWIEQFLTVVTQAQATTRDSIQDIPNVEVYGKVDISNNGGITTIFYYIDGYKYYIEQPYQGIYETDVDIDALVKGVASFPLDYEEDMEFYLTIGAENVKSIILTTPSSSGGCQNADGSPFKKGEKVWLEQLNSDSDLRGVTITALDTKGSVVYTFAVPEDATDDEITKLVGGDSWLIAPTNAEIQWSELFGNDASEDYFGFRKRDFIVVEESDTHGGFHGDGAYHLILDCSENKEKALNITSGWNKLPFSENLNLIMYGGKKDGRAYGFNLAELANMPVIENGCYLFYDMHSESTNSSSDAALFDRASFNFSLAVYDFDTNMVYYFEYDT